MKYKSSVILLCFFCLVGFLANYRYHLDSVYSILAQHHLKNNNLGKAQEYYEKSFKIGLKNTDKREAYVNTIINSPFTIKAQEKLFKFLSDSTEDSATIKAKNFLYEIKEEINKKYPDNFINNAVYNQQIIRWANRPITYSFINKDNIPSYFIKEFENAFTEWENATDRLILFKEDDKNANILIQFEEKHPSDSEEERFIVAYTSPILNFNHLKNMEIVFYLKNPFGEYFDKVQVYNTALHEIAHALGFMGHSNNKDDVMYFSKDSKSDFNVRENLSISDINTIKLLYKIKPQITNNLSIESDYLSKLILDDKEEVNNAKIREAKNYIYRAPNLPSGYIDLAEGYVIEKDYKKAIKYLQKALKLSDTDEVRAIIYYNLAVVNLYLEYLDKAEMYLKQSMLINNSEEKHYLLAEIYTKEKKYEKASQIYQNLLKKNPNNIEYLIALTNICIINKNYFEARNILKEFIEKNPREKNNSRLKSYGILMIGL